MQYDPHGIKKMSDYELEKWTGGFKPGHAKHIAGMRELDRRSQGPALRRATIALWVASGSAVVAVVVAAREFGLL